MSRSPSPLPQAASPVSPDLPRWIRQSAGDQIDTALFSAGAALALLDPLARVQDPATQLWRRRLALEAAAAICQIEGRREGAAQLRDAWVLRRPEDDPGPAGRRLGAWRLLGEQRALRSADWPARLPPAFDLAVGPELTQALQHAGSRLIGRAMPLRFAAEAAGDVLRLGPAHRGLALWVADALLARALGWDRPVPLLAAHLPRAAFRLAIDGAGEAWLAACAAAWGRGAVAALALQAGLAPRAAALRAAAPKLRGRDAQAAVALLLSEDALAAQAGETGSDRAARRLFDRLTGLGLVRELTGRASFRLYGL